MLTLPSNISMHSYIDTHMHSHTHSNIHMNVLLTESFIYILYFIQSVFVVHCWPVCWCFYYLYPLCSHSSKSSSSSSPSSSSLFGVLLLIGVTLKYCILVHMCVIFFFSVWTLMSCRFCLSL